MKTKLKRACKAWASQTIHGYWQASPASFGAEPCYIVPAAEYERLAKVDKLAGRLMQHAACITMHKKCKEMEPIVEKLVRVASEPTLKKARAKQ